MEGFGSSDITTPFNYGSVNEVTTDKDKLETKVKKKFWKTKQKIVEKLGREQDHFVVQGDSEIDAYIEVSTVNNEILVWLMFGKLACIADLQMIV